MRLRVGKMMLALAAVLTFSAAANASPITFSTATGAVNAGGDPVSASAQFTTGTNSLNIVVSNLLSFAQVKDVAQDISQLFFTLSTGQTSGSITTITGTSEAVNGSGVGGAGAAVTTADWGLTSPAAGQMEICVLCASGNKDYTIIGGGGIGSYPNANGSIDGNGPHNPFLVGPVTFVLNVPGVTSNTQVSNVTFGFGTAAGNDVQGTCTTCVTQTAVPEPASLFLFGSGLALAGKRMRRRKA